MERLHALYQHWSWLPHFRAIAETEHLGRAAQMLSITPPALSRALANLESALGSPLFDRHGRRLVLNAAGSSLLAALRTAMRHIDDAVTDVAHARQEVVVKIAAPTPYFASVVLPAVVRARRAWPELRAILVTLPSPVTPSLTSGHVDVCLHEEQIAGSEVVSLRICRLQKVVACARTHPAARRRRLTVSDLSAYEFVAPPASAEGVRDDGWDHEIPRRIGLAADNMQLGVDAAKTGHYLAVLPQQIAVANGLVPLNIQGVTISASAVYATRRRPLSTTGVATERVIEMLRDELARTEKSR